MLKNRSLLSLALIVTSLFACGTKENPVLAAGGCSELGNVSYTTDIATVLGTYCTPCHSTGSAGRNGAPAAVNFDTYENAVANAEKANARVQAGTMPPASQNAVVAKADRCLFQAWVDQGTPEN